MFLQLQYIIDFLLTLNYTLLIISTILTFSIVTFITDSFKLSSNLFILLLQIISFLISILFIIILLLFMILDVFSLFFYIISDNYIINYLNNTELITLFSESVNPSSGKPNLVEVSNNNVSINIPTEAITNVGSSLGLGGVVGSTLAAGMKVKGGIGVKLASAAALSGIGVGSFLLGTGASKTIINGTITLKSTTSQNLSTDSADTTSSNVTSDPSIIPSPLESTFSDILSNSNSVEVFLYGFKLVVFFNLVLVVYLIISFIAKELSKIEFKFK
jgi:hypothetical protein